MDEKIRSKTITIRKTTLFIIVLPILSFFLILSLLTIHEMGHYFLAKEDKNVSVKEICFIGWYYGEDAPAWISLNVSGSYNYSNSISYKLNNDWDNLWALWEK